MTVPLPPETEGRCRRHRSRNGRAPDSLRTVATVLLGAAAGWYLMLQLAPVLRPLMIAVFLAYVLMPYHARGCGTTSARSASLTILAGSTAGVLVVLGFVTYASILALSDDVPKLQQRATDHPVAQAEHALGGARPVGRYRGRRQAERGPRERTDRGASSGRS